MTFTWEKMVDKFTAQAASGEIFQVVVYQAGVTGQKKYETTEGYICERIDDDTFIVGDFHPSIIAKRVR